MFNAFAIAAEGHTTSDGVWCVCGELVAGCWFHRIYFPYTEMSAQVSYEQLFAAVEG